MASEDHTLFAERIRVMKQRLEKWEVSYFYNKDKKDPFCFATSVMFATAVSLERPVVVLTGEYGSDRLELSCKVYGLREIVRGRWGPLKVDPSSATPLPSWHLWHTDALLKHLKGKNPRLSIILWRGGNHFDYFCQSWMKWHDDGVAAVEKRKTRPGKQPSMQPSGGAAAGDTAKQGDSDTEEDNDMVRSPPPPPPPPPFLALVAIFPRSQFSIS